ncbi:MAG: aspartate--tRNA ligase [Patescibacteria group bacterium]
MARILTKEIINKEDQEVELMGWVAVRRNHGKIIFIDLRDIGGVAQVVFVPKDNNLYQLADSLRSEWVVKISGTVKRRPTGMENLNLENGQFEIQANALEILSQSETPPFPLDTDGYEVNEDIRMKYRYLDLRRQRLQKNIRIRANVVKFIRDFLTGKGFLEIETPLLGKSTPEGARDYLVPSRLEPGKFYALPQSPQQYKQLLMVAGFEKYFQIARCFRDEDTRGDRQPEFTQLDIEMSFPQEEAILAFMEELYIEAVKKIFPQKRITEIPFPRIDYQEAMTKYQSDKPDLRKDKNDPDELAFAFIVNFPMFEWKETEKRWDAVHHPFTQPKVKDCAEFEKVFKESPGKILAQQYDFVLNGYEVGGGSIRIHDPKLLQAVFEAMGNRAEDVQEKFGHLLEAFEYGVPPHGGIALGLDRILAILLNEPNIREVIAFPKTGDGRDLMMSAPSEAQARQLDDLCLKIVKKDS